MGAGAAVLAAAQRPSLVSGLVLTGPFAPGNRQDQRDVLPMTDSPAILLAGGGPKTRPRGRVLAAAPYRHPGDVIRLIAAALVLTAAVVIAMLLPALLRPDAAVTGVGPATAAGQVLTGLVQVMIAAAALVLLAAALRYRRFRVLATVAVGFAAAAALMAGITYLAGPGGPVPAGLRQGSWLAGGLPRSGRAGGTGGGRGGRGAVAEPAVAPGVLGHVAADRRGPAGHRRAAPRRCSWCWRWPRV